MNHLSPAKSTGNRRQIVTPATRVIAGRFTGNDTTHKHRSRGMGLPAATLAVVVALQDSEPRAPQIIFMSQNHSLVLCKGGGGIDGTC